MKRVSLCFLLLLSLLLSLPLLSASTPPYLKKEICVQIDGEALAGKEVRIEVTHAMRAKKVGGYYKLYEKLLEKYEPKEALDYLAVGLGDYLSAECERRRIDPLDATLEWKQKLSAPFIYYDEQSGRAADLAEVGGLVARALDEESGGCICAYTREVKAALTKADLQERTREIARFSTSFSTSGENRRHNLVLAAEAISGYVLPAGEIFSFNDVVGERSAEKGFREANIVVNGEFVKGVGGGVCQVSTTLYNAVLLASLPVEYAAAHSCPVSYVPCSRDCTVSSAIDFRFRNDTAHPLYIAAEIKGSTLTFVLYGERRNAPSKLESEIVEHIPYRCFYEDGSPCNYPIPEDLVSAGREGIKSRLYRVCGGERTPIRENLYPAKNEIYKKRPLAA